jgi:hypothetical protein
MSIAHIPNLVPSVVKRVGQQPRPGLSDDGRYEELLERAIKNGGVVDQAAGIIVANGRKLVEPLDGRIRPSFSLDPVLERSNGRTVDMHTGKIGGLLKAFLSGDASITVPRTPAKHYQSSLVILEPI